MVAPDANKLAFAEPLQHASEHAKSTAPRGDLPNPGVNFMNHSDGDFAPDPFTAASLKCR
jgi:hypothetical protein